MPDVQVLYIVSAIVLGALLLWAILVLLVAPTARDESDLQPKDPHPPKGEVPKKRTEKSGDSEPDRKESSASLTTVPRLRRAAPAGDAPVSSAPPAVVELAPADKPQSVSAVIHEAPVLVLPVMRHRLDSHSEIRDGATNDSVVTEEAGALQLSLVSAVGRSKAVSGPQETSAIVDRHRLFLLADGRGRKVQDELASAVVVDALIAAFSSDVDDVFPVDPGLAPRADRLRRSALAAHATFQARAGATSDARDAVPIRLLAAHFAPDNRKLYLAATGPDRVYRLREGELQRLTKPSRDSNPGVAARVDVSVVDTAPDDIYVFGSDSAFIALGDALAEVLTYDASVERLATHFVTAATRDGKAPGMTAIVVRIEPMHPSRTPPVD